MIRGLGEPVTATVVVGSVNGGEWIFVLLAALEAQEGDVPFEVIVADRCPDDTADRIAREHPTVQVIRTRQRTTLPELRTLALERARGQTIFVTEDHTVPPPHWIARFVEELDRAPGEVVAVGGPVDNGMRDRAVDWAAFLCEYSGYLPPQPAGDVRDVPGMNIAYRKSAFDGVDRELLTRGFWESTLHPHLLDQGKTFRRVPDVVMQHRKAFGFAYFMSQRYHYSRYYAGVRFSPEQRPKRLLYGALSAALPPLILGRVVRNLVARSDYHAEALRALPALSAFAIAWGSGEAIGYLFGPGDSLMAIE